VDIVAVDVRVADGSGHPIADLRPHEFTVTVERRPRTIANVEFVSHEVRATLESPPPNQPQGQRPPGNVKQGATLTGRPGRTFLVVVDEANIRSG
jgi:hypothetical protein